MSRTKKTETSMPTTAEQVLIERATAAALEAGRGGGGGAEGETRRDSVVDRRAGIDRRDIAALHGDSESLNTNLERRRGPGRRRTDFMKAADEGEMSQEQFLFIMAIDAFKRVNGKTFPTWTDVLEVIRKLGYRKTMCSELKNLGANTEDWTERADAPAGVFKPAHDDGEE